MAEQKSRRKRRNSRARRRKILMMKLGTLAIIVLAIIILIVSCVAGHKNKKKSKAKKATTDVVMDNVEEKAHENSPFTDEEWAQLQSDYDDGYLILVNKTHELDPDYVPEDLADIKYYASDRLPEGRFLRQTAADAFNKMVEDAEADGCGFVMTTAYRSYEFQTDLWESNAATYGEEEANKTSSRPGQSEHQTGLVADVSSSEIGYELSNDFGNTAAGRWLAEHARDYGFIVRYTPDNESITGYSPEAWHFRYVGVPAARYITENDLTLEEFLDEVKF